MCSDYDKHFRLLICGGSGTGKSTLISTFSFEGGDCEGNTVLRLDGETIRWKPEFSAELDAIAVVFSTNDIEVSHNFFKIF
uniref:ABC transporter domain-containing protein n=1 Tax=Heterorhabditis bacteriophora TaxID=37862 RepID=A0A1I7WPB3_HETBA